MKIIKTNSLNETIFEVENLQQQTLQGIIHQPLIPNGIGLVLIPAGTKFRVGAHNFNVDLARKLVHSGYTILRADTEGLGYSDGEHFKGSTIDSWREVQSGSQVSDTVVLIQAFKEQFQLEKIITGGICGAAMTAQYTSATSSLLDGILSINPTIVDIEPVGQRTKTSVTTTKRDLYNYLQRILSIKALARLFLGKSDFQLLFNTLLSAIKIKL
ncbi:MAG TPA: hypothetical protein ENK52_05505, partial [Saprospiraceae bacterium]|nr:hypothetical protein [Saprospiraceae bacterium]